MQIKKLKPGYRKLTSAKARLIAHLIGDGCVFQSKTNYNLQYDIIDDELIKIFVKDLDKVYGLKAKIKFKKSGKTEKYLPCVYVRSKNAFLDLKKYCDYYSYTWSVPSQIMNSSKSIKKEFLMALYDDEGSVVPQGKKAEIRLYSVNLKGLKQIQKILLEFGIENRLREGYGSRRNVYGVIVKNLKLFHKEIGFYCIRKQQKLEKMSPPTRI